MESSKGRGGHKMWIALKMSLERPLLDHSAGNMGTEILLGSFQILGVLVLLELEPFEQLGDDVFCHCQMSSNSCFSTFWFKYELAHKAMVGLSQGNFRILKAHLKVYSHPGLHFLPRIVNSSHISMDFTEFELLMRKLMDVPRALLH